MKVKGKQPNNSLHFHTIVFKLLNKLGNYSNIYIYIYIYIYINIIYIYIYIYYKWIIYIQYIYIIYDR